MVLSVSARRWKICCIDHPPAVGALIRADDAAFRLQIGTGAVRSPRELPHSQGLVADQQQ